MSGVNDLRERKKRERASMSLEEATDKSRRIAEALFSLPEFKRAKTVAFYVAKDEAREVRTQEMILEALRTGKRVVVPFVTGDGMEFSEISGPSDLSLGAFGISEPRSEIRRPVPLKEIDLIIVPGVAFDTEGGRIGYGKGFYDRFLCRLLSERPDARVVGLAFEMQIVDRIERKPSDIPVHILVTEERVVRCRRDF
jgi:5-formyltetrahydrofolate cyclo-ligase